MSDMFKSALKELFDRPLVGIGAHDVMAPSHRHPPGMKEHTLPPRKSAVMLILFGDADNLSTIFIKRPEYDGYHGGQMAFPGGKFERRDKSMLDTAIRECHEEVGIFVAPSDIVGELSLLHIPVSNLDVYPFVAYLPHLPPLVLDPREVAYTVEARIAQLHQPATVCHKELFMNGVPVQIPYYDVSGHEVWGATAMITAELLAMLH
jgi:8-oxo-dGTP pyrophosphatase MutT (NUDIX family)